MAEEKKVKRTEFATFLNVGSSTAPKYVRIGKGVTGQTLAYNPKTTDEQFIDEENGTSELDSYAPTLPTPQNAYAGNEVFDFVDKLRIGRATGDDAKTDILLVYIYKPGTEAATFEAERNDVVVVINDFGGDAGSPTVINYDLKFTGDPTPGTVTIADKEATFTAK
ncbi:hypothetical protein LJC02_01900 [Breznakia sp. OttesenSCG-928-G09]|nr:hypothetical protein [Breznakia sp. OttesenSCG-928-G09]